MLRVVQITNVKVLLLMELDEEVNFKVEIDRKHQFKSMMTQENYSTVSITLLKQSSSLSVSAAQMKSCQINPFFLPAIHTFTTTLYSPFLCIMYSCHINHFPFPCKTIIHKLVHHILI